MANIQKKMTVENAIEAYVKMNTAGFSAKIHEFEEMMSPDDYVQFCIQVPLIDPETIISKKDRNKNFLKIFRKIETKRRMKK
jgi:hypothetical protein